MVSIKLYFFFFEFTFVLNVKVTSLNLHQAVINPFDRPTDDIIIEADNISVDDKRFSSCWPLLVSDDWDNC